MRQCLNLSRLPKATAPKSLNTRHTTPGYAIPNHIDRRNLVDRHHPGARLNVRAFPAFTCPAFSVRAMPKATLSRPAFVPPDPLVVTHNTRPGKKRKNRTLDISLFFHTMKKMTSKRAVLRKKLRTKMTSAIQLVVTRGADAVDVEDRTEATARRVDALDLISGLTGRRGREQLPVDSYPRLVMIANPMLVDRHLVLKDWTYVITPSLKLYRMPLPNLVQAVRQALTFLKLHASRIEASWAREIIPARKTAGKRLQSTHERELAGVNDTQRAGTASPPTRDGEAVTSVGQLANLENFSSSHPVAPSRQEASRAIPKLFFPSRPAGTETQDPNLKRSLAPGTGGSPGHVRSLSQPETNVVTSARARMFAQRPIRLPKDKQSGDGG
ncbi:hypothetical protein PAXRUDRAFT_282150 [Paxillus rubicundulus Ve08.2h10]|uniref:Uncharacterized protein n=1 Tax=Paxillus rubicundulus Ve08.2h10 TaxID=930991 RepID=A0A0D0DG15_9AGAM|nr:hypothetical protein PAXRUDRAFT_282150 [Paxillus rubicundulus Ve08.2h10]